MASRTRVRLLAALEGARELDTSAESSPQSSPKSSPDSVSSKSSFMRRKLDAAFDRECDLMDDIASHKIEQQITKLKVQALLQLDDETIFRQINENHKKGKADTAAKYSGSEL
jgi:hypothetical protein